MENKMTDKEREEINKFICEGCESEFPTEEALDRHNEGDIEPEDCEECYDAAITNEMEYEPNFIARCGEVQCEDCGAYV